MGSVEETLTFRSRSLKPPTEPEELEENINIDINLKLYDELPVVTTLPGTTSSRCEVSVDLRSTRDYRRRHWGWHGRRQGQQLNRATISTDVILVSSELATLCGDSLEILLSRSIGVADLEKKTLLTNRLAMKFLDNFLTNITVLKTGKLISVYLDYQMLDYLPSKTDTTTIVLGITKDPTRLNSIVHENSTELLIFVSAERIEQSMYVHLQTQSCS